ncbi:MAG: helix-turn-helix domain-containing protein [bacterium]|nr:helix-turn-helix domain-containing protein [bacterium]MDZ4295973.1 helix-turn-helix domain-containing protein [Patescibacteria group bacterium]
MKITEGLQNLGLNEKEARVYAALLETGQASAYTVAQKAGLKNPTTYVILGELMQKGLVLKVPRMKKQLFVAKPPDEFFALAEERFRVAKSILPELMALAEGKTPKVRSLFFEGLAGVREAAWYKLKEMRDQEIIGFYAAAHEAPKEFIDLAFEWCDAVEAHGVRVRGIAPRHPSLVPWRSRYRLPTWNFKFVPFEQYSATNSIEIGDTFVRIVGFRGLQAVIIENPDVARTMRQIFEMVWSSRPEQPHGEL